LEFRSITKIFARDGREGWRYPRQWHYTVSNTADASIVKRIDSSVDLSIKRSLNN